MKTQDCNVENLAGNLGTWEKAHGTNWEGATTKVHVLR
jgi:hypothetical protein